MDIPISGPTNRFLIQQRDRRWPRVLSTVLLVAVVLLAVLALVGWPRLKSTSIHYDLVRLRAEVAELERVEHGLAVEVEALRSPHALAERARALGLAPPHQLEMPIPSSAVAGP